MTLLFPAPFEFRRSLRSNSATAYLAKSKGRTRSHWCAIERNDDVSVSSQPVGRSVKLPPNLHSLAGRFSLQPEI
jgi:hypothetical protein